MFLSSALRSFMPPKSTDMADIQFVTKSQLESVVLKLERHVTVRKKFWKMMDNLWREHGHLAANRKHCGDGESGIRIKSDTPLTPLGKVAKLPNHLSTDLYAGKLEGLVETLTGSSDSDKLLGLVGIRAMGGRVKPFF